ncbi:hypothetical protein midi_00956 [Candidatus Midichloria mitochondrii IricVA]|uniref:Uncharacterized protein n=1 Tax=Midichloria mitochondrii (strain IricVA) TaxID=696127 RepID=F7XX38_MIDMI|nr:hypothetical protein midi_00956 [Candidatus Midichloria mitochondrii IricVA]
MDFPVSLSIVLIPQSSRLSFKSIIHRVFLPLITFSVILFAILAIYTSAVHIPHHSSPARWSRNIFTLNCNFCPPVLLRRYHTLLCRL